MITTQHIEEDLSRAYIQAVAAKAGAVLSLDRSHDYAIDGTFRQVQYVNNRRKESGFHLDFQLKACKNVTLLQNEARYDLDAETHNYLIERHQRPHTNKVILILLALPDDENDWLALSEEQLVLKRCCYWISLAGALSQNRTSHRITIPRANLFTPAALTELFNTLEAGGTLP